MSNKNGLELLKSMVNAALAMEPLPAPDVIRDHIIAARELPAIRKLHSVTDEEAEKLAVELEHTHGVTMDIGSTLEGDATDFMPWLDDAKGEIGFFYWDRYRSLLVERSFSGQVLATLDRVTDKTLGLLENPGKEGRWDRRGMVVGHVQSGKTANYIGLISKAADAGYKVIIVIAGIHNKLRSQTQTRIDEGLIGFDSSSLLRNRPGMQRVVGVGRFNSARRPVTFTNTMKDFNRQTATSVGIPLDNLTEPAVFVIKKNTNTLRNILDWLTEHNAKRGTDSISAPMLLIDDEADNASINIRRGQDEVSRINGQIRDLLNKFDRSCYVGYTATPFANIFVDPESDDEMFGQDLFPKDFIVSLDPPDNYFGASRVFLEDPDNKNGLSIILYIEDNGGLLPLKHPITHEVNGLPKSLKDAVRAFVLVRAIRLVRGHVGAHNSMLVNASRFTGVQNQLRNEIHNFLGIMRSNIRVDGSRPEREALHNPEIAALKGVFDSEYDDAGITWMHVQECLNDSITPIKVFSINSQSSDALDYDDHSNGLNVIAVGGFSLSRGLTLEGLSISYFLRNSIMYDTLMQMGRWFGYRPDYADLCRVWMLEEAEGWYTHIAESIEELRDELRRMEAANATPKDFGLKVRSHPDSLIVTARNKMGTGERLRVKIGLANRFVETAILRRDDECLTANRNAAIRFASSLFASDLVPEGREGSFRGKFFKEVPVAHVLDFLAAFQNHEGSMLSETNPIRNYIIARSNPELVGGDLVELANWDVFFPSLRSGTKGALVDDSLGFEIICQRRGAGRRSDNQTLHITEKQRVSSRGIEAVGLSEDEIEAARESYRNETDPPRDGDSLNYPDRVYRDKRTRPLLVVHLLAIGKEGEDLSQSSPIVAWSISFPHTEHDEERVEYIVNTTWMNERYFEESDEDEAGGDDD